MRQNCRIGKVWSKKDIDTIQQVVLSIKNKMKEHSSSFK